MVDAFVVQPGPFSILSFLDGSTLGSSSTACTMTCTWITIHCLLGLLVAGGCEVGVDCVVQVTVMNTTFQNDACHTARYVPLLL